jgi:RHS repeat-associated protein
VATTRKGFTEHEHLNTVELIHMNGRVYDYRLGRFLSVDPFIQAPLNSQSLNPYSYIMNNPLSGTDPTGYTSCGDVTVKAGSAGTCKTPQIPRCGGGGAGSGQGKCSFIDNKHKKQIANYLYRVDSSGQRTVVYEVNGVFHQGDSRALSRLDGSYEIGRSVANQNAPGSPSEASKEGRPDAPDNADAKAYWDQREAAANSDGYVTQDNYNLGDFRSGLHAAAETEDAIVGFVAFGFTSDTVTSAFQGMRSGGGHAMRHLIDEGLIPNAGSLAGRAKLFEKLTAPILEHPTSTFDWALGPTATRGFAGEIGGTRVVVFVAKEGPFQGRVLSAVVPDANQVIKWGLK